MNFRGISLTTDDAILAMALVLREAADVDEFLARLSESKPGQVLDYVVGLATANESIKDTPVYRTAVEKFGTLSWTKIDELKTQCLTCTDPTMLVACSDLVELFELAQSLRGLVRAALDMVEAGGEIDEAWGNWLAEAHRLTD